MSELAVMVSTCRLTTLVLDFTGHGKLTVADTAKFGGVLAQCPALEHLELMVIKFDRNTSVFDVVARGLTQCTSLTFLRFRDIKMTAGVAECLTGVMGQCPARETLWKRGGTGVVAILARGLMQSPCPWLAEINRSFNQIGPVGTESLTGVVGQCASLVKLDLYYNDIRTRGTESLVGALPQCPALSYLDLSSN